MSSEALTNKVEEMSTSSLTKELLTARTEINNLRKQIRSLRFYQENEIDSIRMQMMAWKCQSCRVQEEAAVVKEASPEDETKVTEIAMKPIGHISSIFPRKKAVPRQAQLSWPCQGKIILSDEVFTNPEHSLEGLSEFSHMWVIFHFDRNDSKRVFAKVAPPRLNGDKTGVFATRAPHRPCPIGLSLVQIHSVEGKTITFSGVDMIDGTPVFDIKPYIPQYDNPLQQAINDIGPRINSKIPELPASPGGSPGNREAPDGEENSDSNRSASGISLGSPPSQAVRVPPWVQMSHKLDVYITENAERCLQLLEKTDLWPSIRSVLREDPRSIYTKQKPMQFYTFSIANLNVSCRFEGKSVTVYRVSDKYCPSIKEVSGGDCPSHEDDEDGAKA